MDTVKPLEQLIETLKKEVLKNLKDNNKQEMLDNLKTIENAQKLIDERLTETIAPKDLIKKGFYVVIDVFTSKVDIYKNLTKEEIGNLREWDCVVMCPK